MATGDALEEISRGVVAVTARALAAVGLEATFAQWRVLLIVGDAVEGASVSEIARRLGAEISPVSRLVTRLAGRDLVVTRKDKRDRRVTRVLVTARGRAVREAVLLHRRQLLDEVLSDIGPLDVATAETLRGIGRRLRRYT